MGTVASGKDGERDESETSGYSDLRDIASALGMEDDDASSVDAEATEIDELEPIGAGYGGAAAAALISDATIETPAANSPRSEPTSATKPPPPPPPKTPTVAPVAAASEAPAPAAEAKAETESKPAADAKPTPPPPPRRATPVPAAVSLAAPAVAPSIPPASSSVAAAPVVARPSTPPAEPEQRKGGMIWFLAAGAIAVAAGAWFMTRDPKPAQTVVVAPDVDADAKAREAAEREAAAKAAAEREAAERAAAEKLAAEKLAAEEAAAKAAADAAAAEAAAKAEAEAAAAAAAAAAADAKVEVSVSSRKKGPKAEPTPVAEDEPKAPPSKPEPMTPQEIDEKFRAECVLNPSKPGCDEIRKRQRNSADLDGNLSDKLTQQQIREGFGKVKSKAKACGGDPGVTVRVKVSISGESGNVISAEALDDHAGTPLGTCVAKALEGASFSRFTSAQQGTVYPVAF